MRFGGRQRRAKRLHAVLQHHSRGAIVQHVLREGGLQRGQLLDDGGMALLRIGRQPRARAHELEMGAFQQAQRFGFEPDAPTRPFPTRRMASSEIRFERLSSLPPPAPFVAAKWNDHRPGSKPISSPVSGALYVKPVDWRIHASSSGRRHPYGGRNLPTLT